MSAVDKTLDTAESWDGYLEKATPDTRYLWDKKANAGSNNYVCFSYELSDTDLFNGSKFGYEWCTSFVVYCFWKNFGSTKTHESLSIPSKSMAAGCVYFVQYLKSAGKYGSTPKRGALIFFKDPSDGEPCHIGFVTGFDSANVYTIEGNSGNGVEKHTYSRSYWKIHGYGYPDYSVLETHEYTEGWVKDDNGWWYRYADGTYPKDAWKQINGSWYYFDSEGYAVANTWKLYNGSAYYLGADSKVVTNRTLRIGADGKVMPAGRFYPTMGDVDSQTYKEALEAAVKKGILKGEGGEGDARVINLSEEAVRVFVYLHRAGTI